MSISRARRLLREASTERDRLRRHLLVAAALREVLSSEPIVVGGTAEEFWTAAEYHQTDLDLCAVLGRRGEQTLRDLGFEREGRHWTSQRVRVAVEFPDQRIDGDQDRTVLEPVGEGNARIIGIDDLYLDRLRQATVDPGAEGIEFHSALAVCAACFEQIDWTYVRARMDMSMRRLDAKIRRRVRRLST